MNFLKSWHLKPPFPPEIWGYVQLKTRNQEPKAGRRSVGSPTTGIARIIFKFHRGNPIVISIEPHILGSNVDFDNSRCPKNQKKTEKWSRESFDPWAVYLFDKGERIMVDQQAIPQQQRWVQTILKLKGARFFESLNKVWRNALGARERHVKWSLRIIFRRYGFFILIVENRSYHILFCRKYLYYSSWFLLHLPWLICSSARGTTSIVGELICSPLGRYWLIFCRLRPFCVTQRFTKYPNKNVAFLFFFPRRFTA